MDREEKEKRFLFEDQTGLKLSETIDIRGGIFQLKSNPNRVVKIAYYSERACEILKKLKKSDNPSVVKIFEFGKLISKHDTPHGDGYPSYHYYIMQKVKNLPDHEAEDIVSIFESHYKNPKSRKKKLSFTNKRFDKFLSNANKLRFTYNDIHSGNIMIDGRNNYKIIDIEGFTH